MWIRPLASCSWKTMNRQEHSLESLYNPSTILQPRIDAPVGRIWCKHCQNFLVIGAESVSHQNLVRQSQVCMDCSAWNYLDEGIEIQHSALCASTGGQRVKLAVGGNQGRATNVPSKTATQEEAARHPWPQSSTS